MDAIATLVDNKILCFECSNGDGVNVYVVNISPYTQHCHGCGKIVYQGSTQIELFEQED